MDLRPEIVQDGLSEVELPSTLMDLKNPTEEYVTNLATQFLNKCDIDTATIIKPTIDQEGSLSLVEYDPEIIQFVNLLGVMTGICSEIFFTNLFLTDLTNPAPKKTRRFAKILSNFLLYAYTKKAFIEETLAEIRRKPQHLDNINRQINECVEMKNKKAVEIAKISVLKEQSTNEVTRLQSLKAARKAKIAEVEERLKAVEKEKLKLVQEQGTLSAEAAKVYKITEELEAKLVRAPEQCEARLNELLEEKQRQMEERSAIEAALQSKKPAIERLQSHLSIVSNRHRRFAEIIDAYQRLQNSKKVLEETGKHVAQKKALIMDETVPPGKENSKATDAILQKTRDECEQRLASMRADLVELSNVKKSLECKLADFEARQQAALLEKEEISASIAKVVKECEQLVAYGQEMYDNEINLERKRKADLESVNQ